MPVKLKKVDGYQVKHGKKISAKGTTLAKAKRQRNLLNAISHSDWEPTGKSAKDVRSEAATNLRKKRAKK